MVCVVSVKRNDGGWAVRLVRENNPDSRAMVERLGFVWRPDLGVFGAYATDDISVARALLDLKQACVVADRGVEEEIWSRTAAIAVTGDVTETMVAEHYISVTAGVAETPRVEVEAPALDPTDAMKAIPVTGDVTEMGAAEDGISVTAKETETPPKRKRGRPPKAEGAMTAAERARRYRRRHTGQYDLVHARIYAKTLERAERLAAEEGRSFASVVDWAFDERAVYVWSAFEVVKTAAAQMGLSIEQVVNLALGRIRDGQWDEMTESWIRSKARWNKEAQPEMTGISDE